MSYAAEVLANSVSEAKAKLELSYCKFCKSILRNQLATNLE